MTSELSTQLSTQLSTTDLRLTSVSQTTSNGVVAPAANTQKTDVADNRAKAQENTDNTEKKVSKDDINQAIIEIKDQVAATGRNINFSFDEELDIVIIKVVNKDTEEVVRQLPSEEVVELARYLQESKGLLLQEEV